MIYVTGISGAGKSQVCKELTARGYLAFGTDEEDISAWWENSTGRRVEKLARDVWKTREWQAEHSWRMSRERLGQIAAGAVGGLVFICGTAANEDEVWDLFSTVICLYLDDATELRRRIKERTDNEFGKEPHELEGILSRNTSAKQTYIGFGATMVDANRPLDEVVANVIAVAGAELKQQ